MAGFVHLCDMNATFDCLIKFTQFCSNGIPDDSPLRPVSWVLLLDRFNHQVHYVKQHPEICAISKGDGWFPDSTATCSTITEGDKNSYLSLLKFDIRKIVNC